MTTSPEAFRNHCTVDLEGDHLTVSCCMRDRLTGEVHELVKEYDLAPLTQFLHNQFTAMHIAEHGDTNVSGLASFLHKAKNAAVRIATSKAAKELYNAANSDIGRAVISNLPGGAAALTAATITAKTVEKARKGNKKALDSLMKLSKKALAGDGLAHELMTTAKTMNAMLDVKEGKDSPDIAHRLANVEARLHPLYNQETRDHRISGLSIGDDDEQFDPDEFNITRDQVLIGFSLKNALKKAGKYTAMAAAAPVLAAHYAAYKGVNALRHKHAPSRSTARKRLTGRASSIAPPQASSMFHQDNAPFDAMPPSPHDDGGGMDAPKGPNLGYQIDSPEEMMANYTPEGEGGGGMDMTESDEQFAPDDMDMDVSGWKEWMYHTPYRSPVSALIDGDVGASTALRSLYTDGLNTLIARAGK